MSEDERGDDLEDLADLYENAPCGYLSLRPDGRIVKVNQTLCNWIGKSAADIVGKRLGDLLNPGGRIFYETHFAPLLRMQGFFHEVALDFVAVNGAILPVLANAVERRDHAGHLQFTRLTIFMATERRRYERELVNAQAAEREARRQLEELVSGLQAGLTTEREASELREQFIAVLGHDLRNPLAAIDSGAKLLLRDELSAKSEAIVRLMQQSVGRMSGLIDNVLDLARSRLGGGISLNIEVDRPLTPTIEQVADEILAANPDRIIEVAIDVPVAVAVDHQRIAQMLSNLLSNAVSHGAKDTPITLDVRLLDGSLDISVSNAGEPIAPEMMEHLFKAFHRGVVRSNAQGLGLGLYIASEIAQAHGGVLEVKSDAEGTTFTFRMPV